MILQLEKNEMAALVLHMSIMRKNIRKGFKSNYGTEFKLYLNSYDEVKVTVTEALEGLNEQDGHFIFNFNIREIDMIFSFLEFYIMQLHALVDLNKVNEVDSEQIGYLTTIKEKAKECKAA